MPPANFNPNNPYTYASVANQKPSFWRRKSAKIGILAILVVIVVIVLIVFTSKSSNTSAQQFLSDVLDGQATNTYQLANIDLRNSTSLSSWKTDVQTIDKICIGKIALTSDTQKSTTAKVLFNTGNSKAVTCHIEIDLVQNSGKWQVSSLIASV